MLSKSTQPAVSKPVSQGISKVWRKAMRHWFTGALLLLSLMVQLPMCHVLCRLRLCVRLALPPPPVLPNLCGSNKNLKPRLSPVQSSVLLSFPSSAADPAEVPGHRHCRTTVAILAPPLSLCLLFCYFAASAFAIWLHFQKANVGGHVWDQWRPRSCPTPPSPCWNPRPCTTHVISVERQWERENYIPAIL